MLFDEWRKFKGWDVLEFFLREQRKIHLKGLAKELKISPLTAQTYLRLYEQEGILIREDVGNLKLYSLADSPLDYELKRTYMLILIMPFAKELVKDNPSITGLVLYGSTARGDYDQSSDIDLLAVSGKKELNIKSIKKLEERVKREVKIEVLTIGEVRNLASKGDSFYKSVVRSSIQLYGAAL